MKKTISPLKSRLPEQIGNLFRDKLTDIGEPDRIFFVSWTLFDDPDGRFAWVWKRNNGSLEEDNDILKKIKIWSFIFPEMRENYLVEKIWSWMARIPKKDHFMAINFNDTNQNGGSKIFKKSFIEHLNGTQLSDMIDKQGKSVQDISVNIQQDIMNLKIARMLKYNVDFNKTLIDGIDKGFSEWIELANEPTGQNLTTLFRKLYGLKHNDSFTRHSLSARKFLTMWQNFSVIFPNFTNVFLSFFIPETIKEPLRHAVVFFYSRNINAGQMKRVKETSKEIMSNAYSKLLENQVNNHDTCKKMISVSDPFSQWENMVKHMQRRKFEAIKGYSSELNSDYNNLLNLARKMAFDTHETRPCKFAFIGGTEQIWPALEEVISLRFFDSVEFPGNKFDPELFARLCAANYSIFQIPGVVGFYNIKSKFMHKIIRLRSPTKEDIHLLSDPIIDLDDLFCWAIEKVYRDTGNIEKNFIFATEGNGKVAIYGLRNSKEADLLLIWDERKQDFEEPISEKISQIIKQEVVGKIGISQSNPAYCKLIKAIRKISAFPGEGACIVICDDSIHLQTCLAPMELLKPSWLEMLCLDDPQYLIRAALIMDGACLITKSKEIVSRLTIYPHDELGAWGLHRIISDSRFYKVNESLKKKLTGKGSKTHASSNLSSHPMAGDPKDPQYIVISISADGPIKIWPHELLKK